MIDIKKSTVFELLNLKKMIENSRKKLLNQTNNILEITMFINELAPQENVRQEFNNQLVKFDTILSRLEIDINQEVEERITKARTKYGMTHFHENLFYEEWHYNNLKIDDEAWEFIFSVIEKNVDFRYPALLMDGYKQDIFLSMISSDPYYVLVAEKEKDKLAEFVGADIAKPIRQYTLSDYALFLGLNKLPKKQFNLILSTQFFSTMPYPVISMRLEKIFSLLRPGGRFICSFIDAKTPMGCGHVDNWMSDPKNTLSDRLSPSPIISCLTKDFFEKDLFGLIKNKNDVVIEKAKSFNAHSVFIFRKNGAIKTVKNKKTLGLIKRVN